MTVSPMARSAPDNVAGSARRDDPHSVCQRVLMCVGVLLLEGSKFSQTYNIRSREFPLTAQGLHKASLS